MDAMIRRKLSMATKALAFERQHPAEDPSQLGVTERLARVVERSNEVIREERRGIRDERAARDRRRAIRRGIRARLLHLARVAEVAVRTAPNLAMRFEPPAHNGPNKTFIEMARTLLEDATTAQEPLLAAGLGGDFLAAVAVEVAAFDAAGTAGDVARGEHIRARAELAALAGEAIDLLQVLDGLNRVRFADVPGLQREWESARNIFGPVARMGDEGPAAPATDAAVDAA